MITPTIHLNGTSKSALLEALDEAASALFRAREALGATAPNGRDYYPQGAIAFMQAKAEHTERAKKLLEVYQELETLREAIDAQGGR